MANDVSDPIRGTSQPGRFWSRTNLGEAVPEVMSPMCWSVWRDSAELGWLYSMYAFGVLPRGKVRVSTEPNDLVLGVFYGRQAVNVDAVKEVIAELPGLDPDDFERDLMGSVRPGAATFKGTAKRAPILLMKAPLALTRTSPRIHRTHAEVHEWWLREVVDEQNSSTPPLQRIDDAFEMFKNVFSLHCVWRFVFQGAQSAVTDAANQTGDTTLIDRLLSGVGDVQETRMSDDLWRLGHGELDEAEFLRNWGYHGPNEGNLYTMVWREDPAPVRAMAASHALRAQRPADRAKRAEAVGADAERRLLEATARLKRPMMRWLMRRMRNIIRTLQVSKASYLMTIDGCRAAVRAFGRQQVAAGVLEAVDDAFFFSVEECHQLAAGKIPNPKDIVHTRRSTREEYKAMVLPIAFTGMPEPIVTDDENGVGAALTVSGAASGGGTAQGRAKIVADPTVDVELEDGDILVCRFTDPSWAPMMALAEAVVIDIGGSASHGAVVARELGIPYVIGTAVGTRMIREGDRVLVDGERNVVRVLKRVGADHG